ncbi:unnamed protein product [Urochloa decumbens]|uniref:SWIM-type domain-containing protein n=1 Tax=Urochloa decumbens TaxID=240449 RepID=A0ABC9D9Q2_9POAL
MVLFDLNEAAQDEDSEAAQVEQVEATVGVGWLHQPVVPENEEHVQGQGLLCEAANSAGSSMAANSAGTTIHGTYATGETLASEESDEEIQSQEVQSQEVESHEQEMQCSQTNTLTMTTRVYEKWEEAKKCYNKYAKKVGFSIKIGSSKKKDKEGETDKVVLVCNRIGKNKEEKGDGPVVKQRKRNKTEKTGCTARLIVNKRNDGKWHVTTFNEDHNHPLCGKFNLQKFLRSQRGIPDEEKRFVEILHEANITAGRVMEIMAIAYDGRKTIPYGRKDVSNLKAKLSRGPKYEDMATTISFFEELKKDDPNFYHKMDLDAKDRVRNLFWVDGAARAAYKEFGDCISFDTTYIQIGTRCPLLPSLFLDAMGGVPPKTIITDQDQAMAVAIAAVFPKSVHRNCRWHIVSKVQAPLGGYLKSKPGLANKLNECMDYSVTPSEYETRWVSIIREHSAQSNKLLQHLYELRKSFIPAYYMEDFFPFLQTTARSEGFNAVLKRYVNPQMSILNFVRQYMKIQEKICCDEEENEFTSGQKVPSELFSGYPIEEQACKFYTRKIYYKFQLELKLSTSYKITEVSGYTYTLTLIKTYVFGYDMRDYMVFADVGAKIYACECSKMKRDGILCCHILKIMTQEYIEQIPAEYLLRRWSNEAGMILTDLAQNQTNIGAEATPLSEGVQGGKQTMKTIRYVDMCAEFAKIAKNASTNEKTTGIVRKHMDDMKAELQLFKEKNSKRQKTVASHDGTGQPKEKSKKVKDPPAAKPKGRPISTRRKPGCRLQEKKKKEKCGLCGSTEHTSDQCENRLG